MLKIEFFTLKNAILSSDWSKLSKKRDATDAKSIKFSLLIATIFSIIGNAVYSFFPIKQVLVLGRFLSGIGNAIDGSMLGYTARINTKA